jgi:hypothetical protein
MVPEIVPPQYRRAVAIHGQRLNDALEGTGMTGPEYLAKLIEFESGWDPTAENPSSAFGLGQFIDSTAADFRNRLGVETQDPKRPGQMIKGASMHASGKYGYGALYAGYNPGYSDTDPIVGVDAGRMVPVKVPAKAFKRQGLRPEGARRAGTIQQRPVTRPFAGADRNVNVSRLVNPKWDPDSDGHTQTVLAKGISPAVRKWSNKYDVLVGAAYDPPSQGGGHVSPGHNELGTATDLYPKQDTEAGWNKLERGLRVLEGLGFEVGYGDNGVGQNWANHGRRNHAHVEWAGQGSDPAAIQKLAGLNSRQVAKLASSGGSGPLASGGYSGGSGGTFTGGSSGGGFTSALAQAVTGAAGGAGLGGSMGSMGVTPHPLSARPGAAVSLTDILASLATGTGEGDDAEEGEDENSLEAILNPRLRRRRRRSYA